MEGGSAARCGRRGGGEHADDECCVQGRFVSHSYNNGVNKG